MKSVLERTPFFSLILPIYNVEKYLDRCIQSILTQDFNDFEIILVDDGSKDNCPIMCDEWAKNDGRISVIHKKNAGLGFARNSGLDVAKGKYVFFVDSDDYISQGLLQEVYSVVEKDDYDMVSFGFYRVNSKNNVISTLIPTPNKIIYTDNQEIKNELLADFIAKDPYSGRNSNLRISAWNCCIKTDFLKENNLRFVSEREYISEDIYFYIELFDRLQKVYFLKKPFYCYCQNQGSLSYSYREDRYKRLKHFYISADELAYNLGYEQNVQFRLKESFIANVMGCLKMEAANFRKVGLKKAYNNVKKISNDQMLIDAINIYPLKYYGITWKCFFVIIEKQRHVLLFIFLLIQFYLKKI